MKGPGSLEIEFLTCYTFLGEQGQVDESLREMAAIEALKSEKADKEVCGDPAFGLVCRVLTWLCAILARAATADRHVRSFRAPKASCLRRVWCLSFSARFRPSFGRSLWWQGKAAHDPLVLVQVDAIIFNLDAPGLSRTP